MIDSHCHLIYDYAPKTHADLIREAADEGVSILINVATDLESLDKVAAISDRFPSVFHTAGIHPHDTTTLTDEDLSQIEKACAHPKCRAVGEIGLDYYYKHSEPVIQRKRLDDQLNLALRVNLPVVIHSRDAEKDLLESLTRYASAVKPGTIPGVIHCFTGTQEFGESCLALGFYISFSGILTFKTAEDLRACAKVFPLERLLVETDSPYLAPIPNRGKKCEPKMVKLTAQKLAEIRGISFEEIDAATEANARRVFKI